MHFHLPKPLHGWREFAGEVGIIVVGVLIALGAEQVVESIHGHQQVEQYRRAANRELAFNLAAFDYRMAQSGCVNRRIAELNEWRTEWQAGSGKPLLYSIGRPSIITMRVSVRNSAPADVLTRIPIDDRAAIAAFYDMLDNNEQQIRDEREAWRSLGAFNHATGLTHEDLMRLDELIYRVGSINHVLEQNMRQLHNGAQRLAIRADFGPDRDQVSRIDPSFCRPILTS